MVVAAARARAVRAVFDLVVANLLADAIVAEADDLARAVAPAGRLIVSGLLAAQSDRVARAFPGWRVVATLAEDDWKTLTLGRA